MSNLTGLVLVESKTARDTHLQEMSQDRAYEVLQKVKLLVTALWKGTAIASTEQVAEFYGVSEDAAKQVVHRHRQEFEQDGLKTVRGKELKDVSDALLLPSKTSQALVWTPRSVMRLGMLLRDSDVAAQVRSTLLDAIEKVIPAAVDEIEKLRLQIELAQTQERLSLGIRTLEDICPGLGALAMGKTDVEISVTIATEKHVLVTEDGRIVRQHQSIPAGTVAKQLGMKQAKDLKAFLVSCDRLDLLESAETIITTDRVSIDAMREIRKLWATRHGDRQRVIGEPG